MKTIKAALLIVGDESESVEVKIGKDFQDESESVEVKIGKNLQCVGNIWPLCQGQPSANR